MQLGRRLSAARASEREAGMCMGYTLQGSSVFKTTEREIRYERSISCCRIMVKGPNSAVSNAGSVFGFPATMKLKKIRTSVTRDVPETENHTESAQRYFRKCTGRSSDYLGSWR